MDPRSQIATTVMPLETNIINTIYVDSVNVSELGNETYTTQNRDCHSSEEVNVCSIPMMQHFPSRCDATADAVSDVQDVLHSALNESQLALTSVESDRSKDPIKGSGVALVNAARVTEAECQSMSSADSTTFTNASSRREGQVSLGSSEDLISAMEQPGYVLPEKQTDAAAIQNGFPPVLSTMPQCVYYNFQQAYSQRETAEEQGLKMLADVISHRPGGPGTDSVSNIMLDNVALSTSALGAVSDDISSIQQSKPDEGIFHFIFPPDVFYVWNLLANNQAIQLTGSYLTKEEAVTLEMKKSESGFHLSVEGPYLEMCSKKVMDTWQYAIKSLDSNDCSHQNITDILRSVRSRRTADFCAQVNPELLSVNASTVKRRGRPRRGKPSRENSTSCAMDDDGTVMTRASRSRGNRTRAAGSTSDVENDTESQPGQTDKQTSSPPSSSPPSSSVTVVPSSSAFSVSKVCNSVASYPSAVDERTPEESGSGDAENETSALVNGSDGAVDERMATEPADGLPGHCHTEEGELGDDENSAQTPREADEPSDTVGKRTPKEAKSAQRYKHSVKSNRSLNKELYELNKKVAVELSYDVAPSDDRQTCVICGNVSRQRWLLLVHLRRFHAISPEQYLELLRSAPAERDEQLESLRRAPSRPGGVSGGQHSPKRAGTLPCHYCGEPFLGIRNMRRHLKLKHGRLAADELAERIRHYVVEYRKLIHRNRMVAIRKANLAKTEYPCRYCSAVLSMSCTRSRHELYTCRKNPNRRKRYHCNYCGTAYRNPEAMERHRAKHAQHDFKFVCDRCGKQYKTKPMLYEHKMKVHQGRQPRYACPVCEKGFHYRDKLEKHLVTHSDKRDVMCDVCGKLFKTKADVQKHAKYVHERSYPHHCEKCGHGVAKLSYLKTHKCGRVRRTQAAANANGAHRAVTRSGERTSQSEAPPVELGPANEAFASEARQNGGGVLPLSGGGLADDGVVPSGYGTAAVGSVTYPDEATQQQQQQRPPRTDVVVSVDRFIADHCADMGYIGPAAPAALTVAQFINPLPIGAVPVYALADGRGAGELQRVDDTLLEQQQQQQQHEQQHQQQTTQIVGGESVNVGNYKMSPYQQ